MAEEHYFEIQKHGDVTVLHLADFRQYRSLLVLELEDKLLELIEKERPSKLLINFGAVRLCPTAAINALLRSKSRMLNYGGQMKLCGMNENVRAEFQMLNLDGTVFDIHDHASEAIQELSAEH